MLLQITLTFLLTLTYVVATPPPGYQKKVDPKQEKDGPKYTYGYKISSEKGTQEKQEQRDGIYALGRYNVQSPGSQQSVEYLADDWGFHPFIQYSNVGPHSQSSAQLAFGEEAVKALRHGQRITIPGSKNAQQNFGGPVTSNVVPSIAPAVQTPSQQPTNVIYLTHPVDQGQLRQQSIPTYQTPQDANIFYVNHPRIQQNPTLTTPIQQVFHYTTLQPVQPTVNNVYTNTRNEATHVTPTQPSVGQNGNGVFVTHTNLGARGEGQSTNSQQVTQQDNSHTIHINHQPSSPQPQTYGGTQSSSSQPQTYGGTQSSEHVQTTSSNIPNEAFVHNSEKGNSHSIQINHPPPQAKNHLSYDNAQNVHQSNNVQQQVGVTYSTQQENSHTINTVPQKNPQYVTVATEAGVQSNTASHHQQSIVYATPESYIHSTGQNFIQPTQSNYIQSTQQNYIPDNYILIPGNSIYPKNQQSFVVVTENAAQQTDIQQDTTDSGEIQYQTSSEEKKSEQSFNLKQLLAQEKKVSSSAEDIDESYAKSKLKTIDDYKQNQAQTNTVQSEDDLFPYSGSYGTKIAPKYNDDQQKYSDEYKNSKLIEHTKNLVTGEDVLNINDVLNQNEDGPESSTSHPVSQAYTYKDAGISSTTVSPIAISTEHIGYSKLDQDSEVSLLKEPIVVAELDENNINEEEKESFFSTTRSTVETANTVTSFGSTQTTVVVTPRPVGTTFLAPITAGVQLQSADQQEKEPQKSSVIVDIQKSVPYYLGKFEYVQGPNGYVSSNFDARNEQINQTNISIDEHNREIGKTLLQYTDEALPSPQALIQHLPDDESNTQIVEIGSNAIKPGSDVGDQKPEPGQVDYQIQTPYQQKLVPQQNKQSYQVQSNEAYTKDLYEQKPEPGQVDYQIQTPYQQKLVPQQNKQSYQVQSNEAYTKDLYEQIHNIFSSGQIGNQNLELQAPQTHVAQHDTQGNVVYQLPLPQQLIFLPQNLPQTEYVNYPIHQQPLIKPDVHATLEQNINNENHGQKHAVNYNVEHKQVDVQQNEQHQRIPDHEIQGTHQQLVQTNHYPNSYANVNIGHQNNLHQQHHHQHNTHAEVTQTKENVEEKFVEVTKYIDRPYPVNVHIPYPVEKLVEKVVNKPYPVEVKVPVEVRVPYQVEKIVEKEVPVQVEVQVPVPQPYAVEVPKPYPVTVTKLVPQPYPVTVTQTVKVPVPTPVEVKVPHPVPVEVPKYIDRPYPIYVNKETQQKLAQNPYIYAPNYHVNCDHAKQKTQQKTLSYLPIGSQFYHTIHVNDYIGLKPPKVPLHKHQHHQQQHHQQQQKQQQQHQQQKQQQQHQQQKQQQQHQQQKQQQQLQQLQQHQQLQQQHQQLQQQQQSVSHVHQTNMHGLHHYPRKFRNARHSFEKNLRIEYGFMPPLIPSLEIDENGKPLEKSESSI